MVWVYDHTESLLVVTLMHASLIACTLVILAPVVAVGMALVIYWLVLAAMLWLVLAAVAVANGGHLSRQPLHKAMAVASS